MMVFVGKKENFSNIAYNQQGKLMENKTAIYDNHDMFRREYWRDGKLVGFYTKEFLDQAGNIIQANKKAEKHLTKFIPGRIIGNKEAINIKEGVCKF